MPVVALFLPVEVAIAVTAIVHLANNLFKIGWWWQKSICSVHRYWRFGARRRIGRIARRMAAQYAVGFAHLFEYQWLGRESAVSVVKFIIGVLDFGLCLAGAVAALCQHEF